MTVRRPLAPDGAGGLSQLAPTDTIEPALLLGTALPAYARGLGLLNQYDPVNRSYNLKASNSQNAMAGIQTAKAGGVGAGLFIGDSLMDGGINLGSSTFDRLHAIPMVFRDAIGAPSGGTGLVRSCDLTYQDARITTSGTWTKNTSNQSSVANGATMTFASDQMTTCAGVWLAGGSGTGACTVAVDGGAPTTVTANSGTTGAGNWVTFTGLNLAKHTVVVTLTSTTIVVVLAFEAWNTTGFIAHNVSQGGSTVSGTGTGSWTDTGSNRPFPIFGITAAYQSGSISQVHVELAGNDLQAGTSVSAIVAALTTLVGNIRAAFTAADIFLHLIPQANQLPVPTNQALWNSYWAAMYQLADTLDCALFDWQDMLGGYAKEVTNGLTGDTVAHLNRAGYNVVAQHVARPFSTFDLNTLDQRVANQFPWEQVYSAKGTLTTSTGALRLYNDTGRRLYFGSVRAAVGTAPTGAALIVDVKKNGTSIWATTTGNRPTIAISGFTATGGAPDTAFIDPGEYFTVDVLQVGSTIAGADLTVKARYL